MQGRFQRLNWEHEPQDEKIHQGNPTSKYGENRGLAARSKQANSTPAKGAFSLCPLSKLATSVVEAFRTTSCRHLETKRRTARQLMQRQARIPAPGGRFSRSGLAVASSRSLHNLSRQLYATHPWPFHMSIRLDPRPIPSCQI